MPRLMTSEATGVAMTLKVVSESQMEGMKEVAESKSKGDIPWWPAREGQQRQPS